ncbi:MAG: YerC/YecD family TrpR-related protein [bacterium]|nr:YerC/YecD family TrpR-related protein [bacterium]
MRSRKLSVAEQESIVTDLVSAIIQAKNIEQASLFIQDLLTRQELENLAKRLRIAKLLLQGKTYEEIEQLAHTSHGTIAKIAIWLAERGEGFRSVISKLPQEKVRVKELSDWDRLKRKYPMYFWPELLLEEVIQSANSKQKQKIRNVLKNLDEKSEMHKKIEQLLLSRKV